MTAKKSGGAKPQDKEKQNKLSSNHIIKLAGCWDVWQDADREYLAHWRFMVKHFGVDSLYMTPVTGIEQRPRADNSDIPLHELPTLADVIKKNPNLTPVIVDENGATPLAEFEHPKNALYLFGKVGYSPLESLPQCKVSVRIPSWATDPKSSLGLLHPHQAAAIVLYDRRIKSWQ
jgi:hypothetical protein